MKYTNNEIVSQIKSGDRNQVIRFLYDHYYPKVYGVILSRGGNREDAKDIFQDTILVLIKRILENRYDEMKVGGFIVGVAVKCWIDKVRKDKRLTITDDVYERGQSDTFGDFLQDERKRELLKTMFSEIGERCTSLFKLVFYENRSMKEVVEKMGFSSVNSAKTQHYKCKQKLMKKYGDKFEVKEILLSE